MLQCPSTSVIICKFEASRFPISRLSIEQHASPPAPSVM